MLVPENVSQWYTKINGLFHILTLSFHHEVFSSCFLHYRTENLTERKTTRDLKFIIIYHLASSLHAGCKLLDRELYHFTHRKHLVIPHIYNVRVSLSNTIRKCNPRQW